MIQLKSSSLFIFALLLILSASKVHKEHSFEETSSLLVTEPLLKEIHTDHSTPDYREKRFQSRNQDVVLGAKNPNNFAFKRAPTNSHSILGEMILGSFFLFLGFPCLWYNEKGYAYTKTFLKKYVEECIPVQALEINPNNENKLICAQGTTQTTDIITDSEFGITSNNSIHLSRHCEGYMWVEHKSTNRISKDEDEVTYTYSLEWSSFFINSENFAEGGHNNNSGDWLFDSEKFHANLVTYGQFKLSESQKRQCSKKEEVPIPQQALNLQASKRGYRTNNVNNAYSLSSNSLPPPVNNPLQQNVLDNPSNNYDRNLNQYNNNISQNNQSNYGGLKNEQKTVMIRDKYLYFKNGLGQEDAPGDFRVHFTHTPCGPITVVGRQSFGSIETFLPEGSEGNNLDLNIIELQENGCCTCGAVCKVCEIINSPISQINWVYEKLLTKQQIFKSQLFDYEIKTWIARCVGFFCFAVGIYLMLSPVYTLLYWFPFAGRYLGILGEWICGIVSVIIAIPLTILTISIAWLFYRKEIGIPLLIVALLGLGYLFYSYESDYKGEQDSPTPTPTPSTPAPPSFLK